MKYKLILEKKNPSKDSQDNLKHAIKKIHPDNDNLISWYNHYSTVHFRRLSFDLDYIHRYCDSKKDRIIEFGAIPPLLTVALRESGYDVLGVDINANRFASAIKKNNISIMQIDIENEMLPFSESSFDIAIFNEIFEHLRFNLIDTISKLKQILKPDGTLILSTPNLKSLHNMLNLFFMNKTAEIYKEYEKLGTLGHMGHVREYTSVEVGEFLEKIGFEIRHIIARGLYIPRKKWHRYFTFVNLLLYALPGFRPYFTIVAKNKKT